jgi:hypothetical protein
MIPPDFIIALIAFAVLAVLGFRRFLWFGFVQWFEGLYDLRHYRSNSLPCHPESDGEGQGTEPTGHSRARYG